MLLPGRKKKKEIQMQWLFMYIEVFLTLLSPQLVENCRLLINLEMVICSTLVYDGNS